MTHTSLLRRTAPLCVAATIACVWLADAGDLNPPAGPITSTMKTLSEVEPRIALNATNTPGDADSVFKIIGPGTYYLTSNVLGQFAKHGIEIAPTNSGTITIDLNGFSLVGGADSQSGLGRTNATPIRLVVRNGTIRNWDGVGANLPNIDSGTFEDVKFLSNYGGGLLTTRSRIINCEASSNIGHGMSVDDGSVIEGTICRLNTQSGIYADEDCTIRGCELSNNTLHGANVEYQALVVNTNAARNGGVGLYIPRFSVAEGCILTENGQGGVYTQSGLIRGCTARSNTDYGIYGIWTVIEECVATSNVGVGISAGGACNVRRCLATSNTSHGISGGGALQVLDCQSQYNGGDGIQCSLDSNTIRGNTCISNATSIDGAGIHMLTTDSVVEGNRVTGHDRGIDIDGTGNIIVRNTCSGNATDWAIAANNVVGPILDRRAPASAAINGFSAPSSLGTTDANANFSY